jgi:Glycosyltransferase family 87
MLCRGLSHLSDILDTKTKWAVIGFGLVLVAVVGVLMVHRAEDSENLNSDFMTYRAVGTAALTGSDIYAVKNSRGWPYVYPPPFAILMMPFAKMSIRTGSVIWYALSVILTGSAVQMCVTMVRGRGSVGRNLFWLYVLSCGMVLVWLVQGAVEGQATILMLWSSTVALYLSEHGRDISGGAALASAALLKAFPLALLAYFTWKHRWRFVMATMIALFVGGIVLPSLVYSWQRNLTYWQKWVATIAQPSLKDEALQPANKVNERVLTSDNRRNQALSAVLRRLGATQHAHLVTAAIGLMMALAIFLVARRTPPQRDLFIAAAWLAWVLVIAPLSHFHYHSLALLPMTLLAFLALVKTDPLLTTVARVTLIAYLLASFGTLTFDPLQYIGLLCWTTLGLWAVLLFVALRNEAPRHILTPVSSALSKGIQQEMLG